MNCLLSVSNSRRTWDGNNTSAIEIMNELANAGTIFNIEELWFAVLGRDIFNVWSKVKMQLHNGFIPNLAMQLKSIEESK
jgi:hypothetical protein